MISAILAMWGCIPEITDGCLDITNASSTYLGIAMGALVGAIVSWWIYNRQKKTSELQENLLERIQTLQEKHDIILKRIEKIENLHESTLQRILEVDKKIEKELDGGAEKSKEP